ncbi:MAG: hypothetical protein A3G91_01645 [Omnitrophica WOR_2 bacterium RIFCSPLOWO2_12_FULL_50_9]|nr:MAG: hypothetical protein A3G91_01645 [Omnitrophica WOR_2 bacterium RIFCSPLOWO2_12_FULL_50_9]
MPYSFVKIEEDKTRTIGFVFLFLILFYFASFGLVAFLVKNFFLHEYSYSESISLSPLGLGDLLIVSGVAFLAGYGHWVYSIHGLIPKILGVLKAGVLDSTDTYHQMFQNIIDEVSVATGGRKMEGIIIPTMAMNAFALADFEGKAVIGVTEGLLARLTRAQIEAVVGHEVAHILKGDCLATTVTSSLFALYSSLLKGCEVLLRARRSRSNGFFILIYILLLITRGISYLMHMLISRQREYRADAIAVRLTRDPLSLAEALYTIAYRWRGASLPAQELEAIFIINPQFSNMDEGEGIFSELFSTHPPVEKRLEVLMNMAHADVKSLREGVASTERRPRVSSPETAAALSQWMVNKDGKWEGPFDFAAMAASDWLRPEMWVERVGGSNVTMAYEDQDIRDIVNKKAGAAGLYHCPRCRTFLGKMMYEGVEINKCSFCQGVLVSENDISKIIIRQEVGFSERIAKIAEGLKKQGPVGKEAKINRDPKTLLSCPQCRQEKIRMMRMFYTEAYRVEVDKCLYCGLTWFDRDELEVLQCLIEQRTQSASPSKDMP